MSTTPLTVTVTGATGQQGGHLARRLLARGHAVRALTRDPSRPAARALADAGAAVLQADLASGHGLERALDGADAAFLVTTPFEDGAEAEVQQARTFGEAARIARVPHVVYGSVTAPMTASPIAHFAAKGRAERLLTALDLPLTIVGAPPFLDNVIAWWHLPWLRVGVFALPGPLDAPMQMVATIDIAGMAAYAIEHRDELVGRRVDIASDELSGRAMMGILERALGRSLEPRQMSFAELDPILGELFGGMGAGPARPAPSGPPARIDLAALHARYPIGWHSFADWVAAQNWKALRAR
jgi:uncharacterized protein YbjT (DUF2867 family)